MEWENASKVEFYMVGSGGSPRRPNTVLENVKYKFINSGVLICGEEGKKIDFIPNQVIQQVTITP
ncbi:MAG: hypothetical protein HWN80_17950 [Candidatus Lokiarchaeota archaeon]|nr:hypothetical protein [Candidatus Lokiarchaeota archaeon]